MILQAGTCKTHFLSRLKIKKTAITSHSYYCDTVIKRSLMHVKQHTFKLKVNSSLRENVTTIAGHDSSLSFTTVSW